MSVMFCSGYYDSLIKLLKYFPSPLIHDFRLKFCEGGSDRRQHHNNHHGDNEENDHDQVDGQQDLAQARELEEGR